MIIYEFFGLLWVAALIIACNQFVITIKVCIWYFNARLTAAERFHYGENKHKEVDRTGINLIFRYNFGSLAFGSLLLALVWFLIAVFNYMKRKLERNNSAPFNSCTKCLLCCCNCCLQCC